MPYADVDVFPTDLSESHTSITQSRVLLVTDYINRILKKKKDRKGDHKGINLNRTYILLVLNQEILA